MNKKKAFILLGIVLLLVFVGSSIIGKSEEVSEDYDTAYYVEANGNLILKLAKVLDKSCFYVVDILISGIGSIFNIIIGN